MSYDWANEEEEEEESGGSSPTPQSGYAKNIGKDLMRKGTNAVKGKAKMAAKKAAVKAGKVGAKGALMIGKAIVASLPVVAVISLCVIGFIFLTSWLYEYDVEERPYYQNYQVDSPDGDNNVTELGVESISPQNLVLQSFYISYAQQSYFKSFNGEIKRASVISEENKDEIWDKYNRESAFYLSENFLWTMDTYLNGREVRYPEAFLKPLYMNTKDGNFEVLDLVDESGNVVVTSKEYNENGERTNNDVPGVWDYGLSPVLNYKEFTEEAKKIYTPKEKEIVVDTDGDGYADTVKTVAITDDEKEIKRFEENVEGYPKTVHMIDKVATFLGVMENKISQEWVMTGVIADRTQTYKKETIYKKELVDKEVDVTNSQGQTLWILTGKINNKYKTFELPNSCFAKLKDNQYEVGCGSELGDKTIYQFDSAPSFYKKTKIIQETVYTPIEVDLLATYKGEQQEYIPVYVGDADFSKFKGDKYLRDYIALYEAYIPEEIKGDFDLNERVRENADELYEMIEQYEMNFKASSSNGSYAPTTVGEMSGTSLQNAYSEVYAPYFQKYAQVYGVDERLLKAMAAQESGGNHDKYLSYERCSSAGCGLMQIEKPGKVVTQATAYNFETKQEETVYVCYPGQSNSPKAGCLDVTNIENNIKVGAMQFASRLKAWDYNVIMALQSYNYGVGGMNTVLKIYEQQEGVNKQSAISNVNDLGWMRYRVNVHLNPSLLGSTYASWKTYGDDTYVEHVLRYFPASQAIEVMKPTGELVSAGQEITTAFGTDTSNVQASTPSGGGSSSGLGGLFSDALSTITNTVKKAVNTVGNFTKSNFHKLFNSSGVWFEGDISIESPDKAVTHYKPSLNEIDVEHLLATMVAMDEGIPLSEMNIVIDDNFWRLKAESFFMNPESYSLGLNESETKSSDPYFDGLAVSPLKSGTTTVVKEFNQASHQEVDLAAPVGSVVVAVSDGVVKNIGYMGEEYGMSLIISHDNGLESFYTNLDKETIKVVKNQEVTQGQELGLIGEVNDGAVQVMHFKLKRKGMFVDGGLILNPTRSGGGGLIAVETSGKFIIPMPEGYVSCEWDCYSGHKGIDLGNNGDETTPIIASASGVVTRSGWHDAFGWHTIIKHNIDGQEYHTLYAHMRENAMVSVGQQVTQAQHIGYMGNTGNSFGAHLHFQIHEGEYSTSTRVNPRKYLELPGTRVRFNQTIQN